MFLSLALWSLCLVPLADGALPAHLTLEQAEQIFAAQGFDLLLADIAVQAAQADVGAAQAVQNPVLGGSLGYAFGFGYDPHACTVPGCSAVPWGASFTDTALSDRVSGKVGLRTAVARAAARAAQQGRADAQRTLRQTIRQAFLIVAIDQAQHDFALDVQRTYARTANVFAMRYEAGAISETDLARLQTEALQADNALDDAAAELLQDKLIFAYLLGVRSRIADFAVASQWLEQDVSTRLGDVDGAELCREALQRRPDLAASASLQQRARDALALGRRLRVPNATLGLAYTQQGTGSQAVNPPTLLATLSLELPVWYQYQGQIAQAEAEMSRQNVAYGKLEAQIIYEVQTTHAAVQVGQKKLSRMRSSLRGRAARARQLVHLQYTKGAASLLDLLDAERTFIAINSDYLRTLQSLWTAVFALEAATTLELRS